MGFTRQSVQVYLKLPQVSRIRFNMSSFLVLSCLFAVAQASHHVVHPVHHPHPGPVVRHAAEYVSPTAHLVRTPQHDSAMVESQRYGGNFAYKTVEKPAYAEVRPIIRKEVVETGVSYSHGPAHVTKHIVPQAPVVTRSYETVHPAAVVREDTHYRHHAPAVYHHAPAVHHARAVYDHAPAVYGAYRALPHHSLAYNGPNVYGYNGGAYGGAYRSHGSPLAFNPAVNYGYHY